MASNRLRMEPAAWRAAVVGALVVLLPWSAHAHNASESSTTTPIRSFRLPETLLPTHYDIYIETFLGDDAEGFKFKGEVKITLIASALVKEIRLHAKDLKLEEEVLLTSDTALPPTVRGMRLESAGEFLVIDLEDALQPGVAYELSLSYTAPLSEGLSGYYRSSYQDRASGDTRWLAVTQFEATDARRAFPCFDEPSFKATFSITLAHHSKYTALSNMPIASSEPMKERPDWVVDSFKRSVRMSTYLVAFVVSDLQHESSATTDNSTAFRVWARREALQQTSYAAHVGPRILTFYEDYFQVKFPLPKQDMVAIPDFAAGAMENWGLITYREQLLLVDQNESSLQAKRYVTSVIAHELAHQWFGNLVTMRWWSDLWLNEGFATYVATLGIHAVHPNWKSMETDVLSNLLTVLKFDAVGTSHPLSVNLKNSTEISQIFDTISYKKGSFLIRMMSHFLTEKVFRGGLTNYLNNHRLDNAEQDDLWEALTAEAHHKKALPNHMTVKDVMDTWTLQTGYPFITISRDYSKNTVNISQAKYLSYQMSDPHRAADSACWEVPLTYTTARQPRQEQRAWLHCKKGQREVLTLELEAGEADWLLLNVNATGLYRVLYDSHGWELLGEALRGDHRKWGLDPLSRANLVEDALGLAWSGDLPYRHALHLLGYLKHETNYLPWKATFAGLTGIYRLLRRSTSFGLFQEFVVGLMKESLEKWGDLQRQMPSDDLEAFQQHELVVSWACKLAVPTCVRQATTIFDHWMKRSRPDDDNPVPRGLRYEVVCTALKHGGAAQWEFVWQRYMASNLASERNDLLRALCCTKDPVLLQRLLEWSSEEGKDIRKQDSATVFTSVAYNEHGFNIAKDFLIKNIAKLNSFYGHKATRLTRYVKAITEDMYTREELEEFDSFVKENAKYLEQATLAVKQGRDKISVNMAWHHAHYTELVQQLQHLVSAAA